MYHTGRESEKHWEINKCSVHVPFRRNSTRSGQRRSRRRSSAGITRSGWRWWSRSTSMKTLWCTATTLLMVMSSSMTLTCWISRICFMVHKVNSSWKSVLVASSVLHVAERENWQKNYTVFQKISPPSFSRYNFFDRKSILIIFG